MVSGFKNCLNWKVVGFEIGVAYASCVHVIITLLLIFFMFLDNIEFTPELPYERRTQMRQIVMGCYTKFLATYETSFWREAGLSGQLTRYTDNEESVKSSPVSLVMDAATIENNAALVGFITGYGACHWAPKTVCVYVTFY